VASSVSSRAPQPPLSPPKSATVIPSIPSSPTKGHMPSKSVPNNTPLSSVPLAAPSQDHVLTKARSTDLKSSRPPNLTLNVNSAF
jgi:hypothetical protein